MPLPDTGFIDGSIFPTLATLNFAGTDLSGIEPNTFQHLNRGTLGSLDLSLPPFGTAPRSEVVINLTGFSNLRVVTWFNNSACPPGFYAASDAPANETRGQCNVTRPLLHLTMVYMSHAASTSACRCNRAGQRQLTHSCNR